MTEPEVLAVQQLAEPVTDESVTRTWYRITQLSASAQPRRRRWIPLTAAAAVVLLAAASLTLIRVGPGRLWPVASSADAVWTLNELADRAAAGSAAPQLKPGQLIYVVHEGWAAGFGANGDMNTGVLAPQPRHIWYDPDGMVAVKITDDTKDMGVGAKPGVEPGTVKPPTGLLAPTLQWLAGLPTEPTQLLTMLRKEIGHNGRWTVDHQLWDALGEFYADCEILLTPQTRAAFLRAAAGMTGMSTRTVSIDGVQLVAVRHTDGTSGEEIFFDLGTGRAVGRGSLFLGKGVTIVRPEGAPALDPGVVYQATWTQSIVDSTQGS
jgi:hypothetical protein